MGKEVKSFHKRSSMDCKSFLRFHKDGGLVFRSTKMVATKDDKGALEQ